MSYTKADMLKMYTCGIIDAADEKGQDFESRLAEIRNAKVVQPKRDENPIYKAWVAAGCPAEGITYLGQHYRPMPFDELNSEATKAGE